MVTVDDKSPRRLHGLFVVVADHRAGHGGHFHDEHVVQHFALLENVPLAVCRVHHVQVVVHVGEHVGSVRLAAGASFSNGQRSHAAIRFGDDRFADGHVCQVHVMAHPLPRAENVHFVVQQHGRDLVGHVSLVRLGLVRDVTIRLREAVKDGFGHLVTNRLAANHFFLGRTRF